MLMNILTASMPLIVMVTGLMNIMLAVKDGRREDRVEDVRSAQDNGNARHGGTPVLSDAAAGGHAAR